MKAPLSWLKEYVSIESAVDEIASQLALTGTEVERVAEVGIAGGENLKFFVVGKTLECRRHPDADKLSVCLVDVGEASPRTIVCGAPNVAAGQTVAVVLPGGVMPDGTRIKEAKLRGVVSSGMIMSEAEIGLAAKSPGIMVLPDEWVGRDAIERILRLSDHVLEVEVTPNRPDCLSVRGMAREIAAITGAPFDEDLSFSHPWGDRPVDADISIEVRDPDLCPRYAARVIRGVKVAESPLWLKAQLAHAGMRPISNVVDVTNYVLWTLGQPLHAFDLHTIAGQKIIVRRAKPGETIVTLDGESRTLTQDMLVIADAERASVVAGIMGGLDSEITDSTTDILLEGANFSGPSIMRTSGALGLRSEASTRYEKGLDPEMIPLALDMACQMFVELCGGEVSVGTIDVRSDPPPAGRAEAAPRAGGGCVGRGRPSVGDERHPHPAGLHGLRRGPRPGRRGAELPGGPRPRDRPHRRGGPGLRPGPHSVDAAPAAHRPRWAQPVPDGQTEGRRPAGGRGPDSGDQLQLRRRQMAGAPPSGRRGRAAPHGDRRQPSEPGPGLHAHHAAARASRDGAQERIGARRARAYLRSRAKYSCRRELELPDEPTRVGVLISGRWDEDSWLRTGAAVDYFLGKGLVERIAAGLHSPVVFSRPDADGGPTEPFLHPGKSAVVSTLGGTVGRLDRRGTSPGGAGVRSQGRGGRRGTRPGRH